MPVWGWLHNVGEKWKPYICYEHSGRSKTKAYIPAAFPSRPQKVTIYRDISAQFEFLNGRCGTFWLHYSLRILLLHHTYFSVSTLRTAVSQWSYIRRCGYEQLLHFCCGYTAISYLSPIFFGSFPSKTCSANGSYNSRGHVFHKGYNSVITHSFSNIN